MARHNGSARAGMMCGMFLLALQNGSGSVEVVARCVRQFGTIGDRSGNGLMRDCADSGWGKQRKVGSEEDGSWMPAA
ncbi:MAG TPA: hypothetical protein VF637_00335 [Sphingomicrobium sp.]|jgi:hypothetical protein